MVALLRSLGRFGEIGATAKLLAKESGVPHRTVKRHLSALVRDGFVQKPYRGQYVYEPGTPDITADPNGQEGVHGVVLCCKDWPGSLLRGSFGPILTRETEPREEADYQELIRLWRGHSIRFRLYPTGTMVVYVAATRNPIPWGGDGGFDQFVGWLGGVLDPVDVGRAFRVVEMGVHMDYKGWAMKGIKAVQLRTFGGAVQQIYSKLNGLRHEVHLYPKRLDLRDAVQIIAEGSPTRQLERALELALRLEEQREKGAASTAGPTSIRPDSQTGYG